MDKKKLMTKFTGEKKSVMKLLDEKLGEAKLLIGQAKACKDRDSACAALDTAFVYAGKALRAKED